MMRLPAKNSAIMCIHGDCMNLTVLHPESDKIENGYLDEIRLAHSSLGGHLRKQPIGLTFEMELHI